jgi:hypothetical protein
MTNKYVYGWKFYVDYGEGWEYENFEDTRKDMIENRRAYRENCAYPLKISRGRELNPAWEKNENNKRSQDAHSPTQRRGGDVPGM